MATASCACTIPPHIPAWILRRGTTIASVNVNVKFDRPNMGENDCSRQSASARHPPFMFCPLYLLSLLLHSVLHTSSHILRHPTTALFPHCLPPLSFFPFPAYSYNSREQERRGGCGTGHANHIFLLFLPFSFLSFSVGCASCCQPCFLIRSGFVVCFWPLTGAVQSQKHKRGDGLHGGPFSVAHVRLVVAPLLALLSSTAFLLRCSSFGVRYGEHAERCSGCGLFSSFRESWCILSFLSSVFSP